MSDDALSLFRDGLLQLGLLEQSMQAEDVFSLPTDPLYRSFVAYRQELLEWNTRFNLTAIKDPEEVLLKHFLDSLSLLQVYHEPGARLLDIGSGAGFPGLPLKLARPDWHVTLLEATGKRVTFLRHMVDVLQLDQIEVLQGRAEDLARQQPYRGSFDLVTARAVASLPVLLEYAVPYCRPGGCVVLPKKGDISQEIAQGKRAARQLGAVLKEDVPVTLPGLADGRRLLVWEQQQACPSQFPRHGAAIARSPLG